MHCRNFIRFVFSLFPVLALAASPIQERADRFLKLADAGYQALYKVNSEAQWLALTDVTPEHDAGAEAAGKAYAAFNGNPALITEARELLTHEKELTSLSVRELRQLLLNAAEGPMTNPDLVNKRVEAETKQSSLMNGFEFKLNGQKITANDIDNKLQKSTDLEERKAVWLASKEIGPTLKENLSILRDLRNGVAKEMQYPDYFALQVSNYGMSTDEMLKMLEDWMNTLRPLYLQLHTWTKYKLAEKYHQPVPKKFRRIGSTIVGRRSGKAWSKRPISTNISRGAIRNGSLKPPSNSILASDSHRCPRLSGRNRICSRSRLTTSERKTRTLPVGMSILRTTSARSKASNRTRAGFSPRIMSSATDIISRLTRDRKCRICCAPAPRPDFTKALAN